MKSLLLLSLLALLLCCCQQPVTDKAGPNVFLITLDGYRWQELFTGADSALINRKEFTRDAEEIRKRFWADTPEARRKLLTPFFWTVIAREGQLYGNRLYNNKVDCSNTMWFSYPGYNEILSGYADDARITSNDKIDNPNKTVLEYLNEQPGFSGKVAAFGSWDVFPFIINRERSGIPVNAGFETAARNNLTERELFLNELQPQVPVPWGSVRLDAFTHHYAMEYIKRNKPRVVYIAYGETDDFAHDGDYSAYLKSARQTDQFIQSIWTYIQETPHYKDKTTLIITTDHGRGTMPLENWKSHGSSINGAGQIWLAAIGPQTPAVGEVKDSMQLYQSQVAKTVASSLGIDYVNDPTPGEVVHGMINRLGQLVN